MLDDGVGFDAAEDGTRNNTSTHHNGLFNTREPIEEMVGQMNIRGRTGYGTAATITMPLTPVCLRAIKLESGNQSSTRQRIFASRSTKRAKYQQPPATNTDPTRIMMA